MEKGKIFIVVLAIVGVLAIFGSCGDSDSSESEYSGYSSTYKNSSKYRDDVKDIADAYGISEKEVDRKINAITGGK